jgi:hypothetical protein
MILVTNIRLKFQGDNVNEHLQRVHLLHILKSLFLESKAPVGSSAKMILGYVINARAADVR